MRVVETFVSIQGETTWAGIPCFFIRLAGCNLRCAWCDTAYARDPAAGREETVAALVQAFHASGLAAVMVTGGEPLLQEETPALVRALREAGAEPVLVETNGSRDIGLLPPGTVAVVDVKGPSSGMADTFHPGNLDRLRPTDEIKFVVADRTDYEWAVALMRRHALARRCRAVLFSAVAGRLEARRLAEWLVADRLPARLQIQLHKVLGLP